jgi:hypothetical protein
MDSYNKYLEPAVKKSKENLKDDGKKFWWACGVLGDRLFPGLVDRVFLKIKLTSLIMVVAASIVPILLIAFAIQHFKSFGERQFISQPQPVQAETLREESNGRN